jgi:hypothetical protein
MQEQAREMDHRHVEMAVRLAELEKIDERLAAASVEPAIQSACNPIGLQSNRPAIQSACNPIGLQSNRPAIQSACNPIGQPLYPLLPITFGGPNSSTFIK